MKQLIATYKRRLAELYKEYKEHRENDAYKTYVYGKILTYELVIKDLRRVMHDERRNS